MPTFDGRLNANEIFASLYNMIISQQVFADNIAGTFSELCDQARVDGGLHGDTKLYYATDALKSAEWGNDAEALNLLALHRPTAPKQQKIVLNKFRQIALTVDNYLTKRAWSTEDAFTSFNSIMLGWIYETKKIYDSTHYNTFIGTNETSVGKQERVIDLAKAVGAATGEEKNRLEGSAIAEDLANLLIEMKDISRDFNDYGFLRSYSTDSIKFIWNSKYLNKIEKRDLPTIFHQGGLVDKLGDNILPSRYFGKINSSSGTTAAPNTTIRSLVEKDYGGVHCFPGDLLPATTGYAENETYTVDDKIICKVIVKLPPFMSAFQVGTSFFNPKSLTQTNYLTWGFNTLEHLKNYPFITIRESGAKGK